MQSNLNRGSSLQKRVGKSSGQFINSTGDTAGLDLIRRFEGLVLQPYLCPANYWTGGYGHRLNPSEVEFYRSGIPIDRAESWLREDTEQAMAAACRLTQRPLEDCEIAALGSFVFNLGAAAYQRSTLRKAVERQDAEALSHQWLRWVWAGGRKLPGLLRRRAAELALYQATPWEGIASAPQRL